MDCCESETFSTAQPLFPVEFIHTFMEVWLKMASFVNDVRQSESSLPILGSLCSLSAANIRRKVNLEKKNGLTTVEDL